MNWNCSTGVQLVIIIQLDRIAYNDDHLYRVFFEVEPVPSTKERGRDRGITKVQGTYETSLNRIC